MKNVEDNFTNENGNLLWLPSDFYYDVLKFKSDSDEQNTVDKIANKDGIYHYNETDDCFFLEIDSKIDENKFLYEQQSKDVALLTSMLELRIKLNDNIFSEPMKLLYNGGKLLTKKELSSIEEWCSKYGYPFMIPYKDLAETQSSNLFKKISENKKWFGFRVVDFLVSLNNLYCCFKIYSFLSDKSNSIEKHIFLIDTIEPLRNVELHRITIEECKELFEKQYNRLVMDSYVSTKDGLHIKTKARSLFDAAMYQLALVMYDNEQEIRICKCCGNPFIQKNRRKKYCDTCSPQKYYAQKKRQAKRQPTDNK